MTTATRGRNQALNADSQFISPKLIPRFQPMTRLKNGVTGMTRGGFMTTLITHHLLA